MDEDKSIFYGGLAIIVAVIVGVVYFSNQHDKQPPPVAPTVSPGSVNNPSCYTSNEASNHEGESGCVDFHVGYVYESSRGNKFLDESQNYTSGFSVYIPSDSSASNIDLNQYDGKNIEVTGEITNYNGAPEIIVTDPSQIKVN